MGHRRRPPAWPFVLPLAVALLGGFTSAEATPGGGGGPTPTPFSIGLIGDWGYTPDQRARLPALIDHMNDAGLAFSVHDGDIKNGPPPCSDEIYFSTRRLFNRFSHPLVYTPGDNEWTDCWRSGFDPNERLRFLRPVFFSTPRSLGARTMPLDRQSRAYPENARWYRGGVTFATLHVVGSNNHLPDAERPGDGAEFSARNAADLTWLRATFAAAAGRHGRGIMLFIQADPLFEQPDGRRYGYDEFLRVLTEETVRFRRPVVLVHGDTHAYRLDQPMVAGSPPRPVRNFTRVETHGPKDLEWVRATVDPTRPGLFRFRPETPPG